MDGNLENMLALLYFMRAPAVRAADAPNRSYPQPRRVRSSSARALTVCVIPLRIVHRVRALRITESNRSNPIPPFFTTTTPAVCDRGKEGRLDEPKDVGFRSAMTKRNLWMRTHSNIHLWKRLRACSFRYRPSRRYVMQLVRSNFLERHIAI